LHFGLRRRVRRFCVGWVDGFTVNPTFPVDKLGCDKAATQPTRLIQGDNLGTLKALLPLYAGKVKYIYIDPPYNTRSAFEYYDDNLEHSVWLSMIYPRLELLRELYWPRMEVSGCRLMIMKPIICSNDGCKIMKFGGLSF
jgi:hypothetical protein